MKSTVKLLAAIAAALMLATTGAQAQEADTDAASNLGTAVVGSSQQGGMFGGMGASGVAIGVMAGMGVFYAVSADDSEDTVQPERPPPGTPQPVPPPHHGTGSH